MEDILKVVVLALIEGLTEFLPISSTGHLIVGKALLEFDAMGPVFEIVIQLGAVAAVMVYYRRTLLTHAVEWRTCAEVRRFWLMVVMAFVPAAAFGFFFAGEIEKLFSPLVVALSLIVGGLAFLLVEGLPRTQQGASADEARLMQVSPRQAIVVGLAQVLALIPGMSRSGTTIVGGLLAGMSRRAATEFSFFLAMPVLGGATLYTLFSSLGELDSKDAQMLLIGAVLSGLFAWLAIDWLLKYVSRSSFVVFGYYRIAAGLVILAGMTGGVIV